MHDDHDPSQKADCEADISDYMSAERSPEATASHRLSWTGSYDSQPTAPRRQGVDRRRGRHPRSNQQTRLTAAPPTPPDRPRPPTEDVAQSPSSFTSRLGPGLVIAPAVASGLFADLLRLPVHRPTGGEKASIRPICDARRLVVEGTLCDE